MTLKSFIVPPDAEGKRLLAFLKNQFQNNYSQKDIRYAIEHFQCQINGKVERFESTKVKAGATIAITIDKKPTFVIHPERILYEDAHLCIYNKEAGISSTGEQSVEALLGFKAVHRLDRDTSGILLFAKEERTKIYFENLFRDRKIYKSYLAVVLGVPKERNGVIENFLGKVAQREGEVIWGETAPPRGVYAKSEWQVEKTGQDCALLRVVPRTGRTHQIRVHLSGIGHPIRGDYRYGKRSLFNNTFRPLLHAEKIAFFHPVEKKRMDVRAPVPEDFVEEWD